MESTWLEAACPAQIETAIDSLRELGDSDLQRRLWNSDGSHGQEVSSFTEVNCRLFDDSGLGDDLAEGCTGLSSEAVDVLKALDRALESVNYERRPNEIIEDPAMQEVRKLARKAMRLVSDEVKLRTDE